MTIYYVNTGSGPNTGDGDSLRVAFTKINSSFDSIEQDFANLVDFVNVYTTSTSTFSQGPWYVNLTVNGELQAHVADMVFQLGQNDQFTLEPLIDGGLISAFANKSFYIATNNNNNIWKFGDTGNLVLPQGGAIYNADGSPYISNTNANTGNFRFNADSMYDHGGANISNADTNLGATAALQLPANSSASSVYLYNYNGDINLVTGSTPYQWTFGISGDTTVPGNIITNTASTVLIGNTNQFLKLEQSGVVVLQSGYGTDMPVVVAAGGGSAAWAFDAAGQINTPSLLPTTFTAVLDSAHMVNAVAFTDTPWQMSVTFVVDPDGVVETQVENIFPILNNPGYVSGYTFEYTEADHGIPGYTFSITLNDVVLPGGAGWTSNIAVSEPPVLPSTIYSETPVKVTAGIGSFVLGTDGGLAFPPNPTQNFGPFTIDIPEGQGTVSVSLTNGVYTVTPNNDGSDIGGTIQYTITGDQLGGTSPANNLVITVGNNGSGSSLNTATIVSGVGAPVYGHITFPDGSVQTTAYTGGGSSTTSTLYATDGTANTSTVTLDPYLNINLNYQGQEYGYLGFDGGTDFYIGNNNLGGSIYIETENPSSGNKIWKLDSSGNLTFPDGTIQTTAWTGSTSTLVNGSYTVSLDSGGKLNLPYGQLDFNAPYSRFKDATNTGVQLGSPDDQNYVNVDNTAITIQTNSDGVGGPHAQSQFNWVFDNNGTLTVPNVIQGSTGTVTIGENQPSSYWAMLSTWNGFPMAEWGASSAYDSQGNLYVVGLAETPGPEFAWMTKLSPTGQLLWKHSFDNVANTGTVTAESLEIGPNGNAYVLMSGVNNFYILQIEPTLGTVVSTISSPTSGSDVQGVDIAVDANGNQYVLGYKGVNTFNFNGHAAVLNTGTTFVAKIDYTNTFQWAQDITLGEALNETYQGAGVGAIEVHGANIYVAGGSTDGGGNNWAWTAKMDLSGNVLWLRDANPGIGMGVTIDSQGNVYSLITADNENGSSTVIKYDTNGNFIWMTTYEWYTGGGDVDIAYDGEYLYLSGSVYSGTSQGPNHNDSPGVIHWAKIDPNTGNVIFEREFGYDAGTPLQDVWWINGHRLGGVHNGVIGIAAITYNSTGTVNTGSGAPSALVLQLSTDGANTGTYGAYSYGIYNELVQPPITTSTQVLSTGSGVAFTASSYTFAMTTASLAYDGQSGIITQLLNTTTTITTGSGAWVFNSNNTITFPDGTIQTTAWTGTDPIYTTTATVETLITNALNTSTAVAGEWTSPNNNQWFVTTWNSGFSGTYDGTNPLVWFDPSLATIPTGLSASNVRGGVVEYHAFDGQDTIVGTIWFSGDYNTYPSSATHIEHSSGGNNAELKSYWTMTQNYPIKLAFINAGGSIPIMVQWTARLFWGSENAC